MKQQNWISVRLLIGLSKESDKAADFGSIDYRWTIKERAAMVKHYLSRRFSFGGSYVGTGLWEGKQEPCMMFESIGPETADTESHAREVARELARMLDQESVGVVIAPVRFETVRQD